MTLKRLFTEHPDAVGESYVEHMKVALSFAGPMALGAFAAFVHSFLPFLFTTTASGIVRRLHGRMTNRVPQAPIRQAEALPANGLPVWDPVI